jgi:hypothetical protein
LVEQFQDLGSPETLNDEDQDTPDRTCLKVYERNISFDNSQTI